MNYGRLLVMTSIVILMVACINAGENEPLKNSDYDGHKVTIVEVITGKTYSYLLVSEKGAKHWIAVRKVDVKDGDTLYYLSEMEMRDFKSKELDRTFKSIGFVSRISNQPISKNGTMMHSAETKSGVPSPSKSEISVETVKDGITIGKLFSDYKSFSGKTVIISGKIVKFNSQIMGRNWTHIQDGTNYNNKFDLTVTTKENLTVGEIVTLKGTIATSKDFGAGYSYDVIMESATIVSE